jgi:hypothetical protein
LQLNLTNKKARLVEKCAKNVLRNVDISILGIFKFTSINYIRIPADLVLWLALFLFSFFFGLPRPYLIILVEFNLSP